MTCVAKPPSFYLLLRRLDDNVAKRLFTAVYVVVNVVKSEEEEHRQGCDDGWHPHTNHNQLGVELWRSLAQRIHYGLVCNKEDKVLVVKQMLVYCIIFAAKLLNLVVCIIWATFWQTQIRLSLRKARLEIMRLVAWKESLQMMDVDDFQWILFVW